MLSNQRHLFELPDDAAYFRCAATAPLMRSAHQAGEEALALKTRPWGSAWGQRATLAVEEARDLFAEIIGANGGDIALTPSAGYGLSIAAHNLTIGDGREVLVLADQFPSNIYPWGEAVRRDGGSIRAVERPEDGDWSAAAAAAIEPGTAVVAVPLCHWLDGTMLDLPLISARCREVGAALVLDLSQSAGALGLDLATVDPDYAVSVAEKWLLGPVQLAFLYVAPRRQAGTPIEHGWVGREASGNARFLHHYTERYRAGARRFDVGERANIVNLSMAIAAMTQITDWRVDEISGTLRHTTDAIAEPAAAFGYTVPPRAQRAPHFLGLRRVGGWPADLQARFETRGVLINLRGDVLRVAPHLFTNQRDIDALLGCLSELEG